MIGVRCAWGESLGCRFHISATHLPRLISHDDVNALGLALHYYVPRSAACRRPEPAPIATPMASYRPVRLPRRPTQPAPLTPNPDRRL